MLIQKAKVGNAVGLDILTLYTTPDDLQHITAIPQLRLYTVYCHPLIDFKKDPFVNDEMKYWTPKSYDYIATLTEVLPCYMK